jgi:hypothetical protein
MDTKNSDSGDKGLSSAEYRARLLTKLNCLIAVLEVAITKISRSMDLPGANEERLLKIRSNLENTLSICNRAKQTLEGGMPRKALPGSSVAAGSERKMSYRDYVELSSIEEYKRFKGLPPIRSEEIGETDIDGLIDQFFAN